MEKILDKAEMTARTKSFEFSEIPSGLAVYSQRQVNSQDSFSLSPRGIPGVKSFRRQFKQVFSVENTHMQLLASTFLLFALNILDALLTIVWVRAGVATESNQLMAKLLDIGNGPFLIVKIAMGTVAAAVLFRWGHRRLARYGLAVALAVYISLMGIHLLTGLSAFGYVSNSAIHDLTQWPGQFLAMVI